MLGFCCPTRSLPRRSDTPLHIASIEAHVTILELLIRNKASMLMQNDVGCPTPYALIRSAHTLREACAKCHKRTYALQV